jgi:hypothetical protein
MLAAPVFGADNATTNKNCRTGRFIFGADISWAPEDEADGAQYFDIIGMSCYAQAQEGDWKNNFADLANFCPNKGLHKFK